MLKVDIEIARQFEVNAGTQAAWELLADPQAVLAYYPKLKRLVDLGNNQWRWELEPTGIKSVSHQVIYSVQYAYAKDAGKITWTPLDAEPDNASIQGSFTIKELDQGCEIILSTQGSLEIDISRFLKVAAKPVVEREFQQQITGFVSNLKKVLGT